MLYPLFDLLHRLYRFWMAIFFPVPARLETNTEERALGILGLTWALVQLVTAATDLYVPWAWALLFVAPTKFAFAFTCRLRLRAGIAALGCTLWLSVAIATVVSQLPPQVIYTQIALYTWVAWHSSYNFVELISRASEERRGRHANAVQT